LMKLVDNWLVDKYHNNLLPCAQNTHIILLAILF
jgi:hypothetical protein